MGGLTAPLTRPVTHRLHIMPFALGKRGGYGNGLLECQGPTCQKAGDSSPPAQVGDIDVLRNRGRS